MFHLVVSQPNSVETLSHGSPSLSHLEESSYDRFPVDGSAGSSSSAAFGREEIQLVEPGIGESQSQTVYMLQNTLLSDGTRPCECLFFSTVLEDQQMLCQSHGVIVHKGSDPDFSDALLKHLFTGLCGLRRDEQEHASCDTVSYLR